MRVGHPKLELRLAKSVYEGWPVYEGWLAQTQASKTQIRHSKLEFGLAKSKYEG